MTTDVQLVTIQVKWQFQDGGAFMRSNMICGYQAEIDGRNLRVYNRNGDLIVNKETVSRRHGMDMAGFTIARLIEGTA